MVYWAIWVFLSCTLKCVQCKHANCEIDKVDIILCVFELDPLSNREIRDIHICRHEIEIAIQYFKVDKCMFVNLNLI